HFGADPEFHLDKPFAEMVLQMRENKADATFTERYLDMATAFVKNIIDHKSAEVEIDDKLVVDSYYKA
ncbi:MAG: hypothetical protein HKN76_17545, partial [Saprospiraceae bacterium]|nr:hypothetical protein [Saprospiraceae bacterium]